MKPQPQPAAKYAAEFAGTLILVFVIACNVHTASLGAALSIGGALAALIYTLGPLSGGHFNPAVSLAVFFVGGISAGDLAYYMVSQVAGGLSAAVLYLVLLGHGLLLQPAALYSGTQAAAVELIYSTALCYVVLGVTCTDNAHFGLAIGSTVTAAAIAAGPISGCCLNPAVAAGSILVAAMRHGPVAANYYLMYVSVPFFGAALASVFSTLAGNVRRPQVFDDVKEDEPLLLERGTLPQAPISYRTMAQVVERSTLPSGVAPVRVVRHEPFRLPGEVVGNDLVFGCRWLMNKDTLRGQPVETCDVDLACAVFDDTGACIRGVYFCEKSDPDNGLYHLGDEVLGGSPRKAARRRQDNETIKLKLSKLQPNVHALVFTVMVYTPDMHFGDVKELCVRLIDISREHREICRYEKKDLLDKANTLIAAMVYRDGQSWVFKAVDESYELPSHSTYRRLIPDMSEMVHAVLPARPGGPATGTGASSSR